MIGAYSGFLIVLVFFLAVGIVRTSKDTGHSFRRMSLSDISNEKKDIGKIVMFLCIIIAILNIFFTYGLSVRFQLSGHFEVILMSALSSIFLILTGLTVIHPDRRLHLAFALIFFLCFFLFGFILSIRTFAFSIWIAGTTILIILIDVLLSAVYTYNPRLIHNGIAEVGMLALNSLWIILYASEMIY